MSGHKRAKQKKFDKLFKVFRCVYLPQSAVVKKLEQPQLDAKTAVTAYLGPLTELKNTFHRAFANGTTSVVAGKTANMYWELKRVISPKEPNIPGQVVTNAAMINPGSFDLLKEYGDIGLLMLVHSILKANITTLKRLRDLGD